MRKSKTIEHVGEIISINDREIKVEIINKSMCAGCHAKSVCAMGDAKEKIIIVPNLYKEGLFSLGEKVDVVMKKTMGFKAVWISYVIPLAILLLFLLTLQQFNLSELLNGLLSVLAVAIYYIGIYIFRDKIAREFTFSVVKRTNI